MKTSILFLILFTSSSFSQAQTYDSKNAVITHLLEQVNTPASPLGQHLAKVRKEKTNGFLPQEDQIIPLTLSAADLSLMKLDSEHYVGKMLSETERDPGYLFETFLISVMANEATYGGRINSQTAILIECHYSKYENEKTAAVSCNLNDSK